MVRTTWRRRASDQREAMRLAWNSLHFPFVSLFVGALVVLVIVSAVSSIIAMSPANGIP